MTKMFHVNRHIDRTPSMFSSIGRHLGNAKTCTLDRTTIEQAHRHVLFNCHVVTPFREKHTRDIKNLHPRARPMDIEQTHTKDFPNWFMTHIQELHHSRSEHLSEKLRWLAGGPSTVAAKYKGFLVKGFRFHTKESEQRRKLKTVELLSLQLQEVFKCQGSESNSRRG
ncbi:uncharacterized protein LOC143871106 isoform X1 [Tasmannia lanceolata]|uniref:uncharacterized protein LOC143871106 isoform X1 n=1 Tax=Tasmannia lanceolata TaxID=3420 RepID=UPI0040641989